MADAHTLSSPSATSPSPRVDSLQAELATLHRASFGWALACCSRNATLAEDVLQEAYFKILDGRARFHGHSTLKTWLFGVIRLTAREHTRPTAAVVRWLRGAPDSESTEIADSRRAPESEAALRERAAQVVRALERLPARQREVLHLVFYEDLTISEAAMVMSVSIGTARQHYERGKQQMLALLPSQEPR